MLLRVLTLNLWATGGDWPARRQALRKGLKSLRPDVAAFQESIVNPGYDQLAELLDEGYHITHQQRRQADGMGVSVASRWPIKDVRELDLHLTERTGAFPCVSLAVELSLPRPIGQLIFVNHFPSYELELEHERQLQAVAAAGLIEEMRAGRPIPVIVAGDLDAEPAAGSIRFWTGHDALGGTSVCYRDAWESAHPGEDGHTFTPRNPLMGRPDWPFRRIDYILVRRVSDKREPLLEVAACELAFDLPVDGVWASDHFGVLAELKAVGER